MLESNIPSPVFNNPQYSLRLRRIIVDYYISQLVRALQSDWSILQAVFYRTVRKIWKALDEFTAVVLYTEK